jgi:hypothetical protein
MRIPQAVLALTILCWPNFVCTAQTPASDASTAPASPAAPPAFSAAQVLQPPLDNLQQALAATKLERWKRGTVRDEAGSNISKIQHDLQETLPALLKAADGAPETLSKGLPVSRNVDALYDVLVHVVEASRVSAPPDQVTQLQQAMNTLEKARVAFDNHMQNTAVTQEKQIVELHTTIQTQITALRAAAVPQPTPTCVAPTPAHKPKPKAKAPAKPGTTTKPEATTPAPAPAPAPAKTP